MRRNELNKAKNNNLAELNKQLIEAKKQMAKTQLEMASGKVKNSCVLRSLRKDIAQLSTIITKKIQEEAIK